MNSSTFEDELLNAHIAKPEFYVECAMCGGTSFSATADTLKEIVEIVAVHLRQVKDAKYEPHKEYFAKHPGAKREMENLEKPHPDSAQEILTSPFFIWAIQRLQPFTKIYELFQISPFPLVQPWLTTSP
jgi:hypothetical protein